MKVSRIYGQKVDIKKENTKNFYDNRAKVIKEMDNPYVSVLLGDQNPEYALAWDRFEKKNILPKMNVDETCSVLDIGCGMRHGAMGGNFDSFKRVLLRYGYV